MGRGEAGGFSALQRQQVADMLERFEPLRDLARPPAGWIRTIRTALGMTGRQLAQRLGVAQPTVAGWERREPDDAITLSTLRKIADALGCELVYAFVPRAGDLGSNLERRARQLAERAVDRASHSMALEDQAIGERERARQVDALTREHLSGPAQRLWEDD